MRWLRIEREERPWMFALSGAIFFLVAAAVLSNNLAVSSVVKRAGVGFLPYYFILSAFALLCAYGLSGRLHRLLPSSGLGVGAIVLAVLGSSAIALTQGSVVSGSSATKLISLIVLLAFTHGAAFAIALDKLKVVAIDLFNIDQLKRLFPLLISVSTASAFLSGLFLAFAGEHWSISALYWTVPVLLCVSGLFYLWVRDIAAGQTVYVGAASRSLWADWRGGQFATDKHLGAFVGLLSVIIGLSAVFSRLFQYQYTVAANAYFPTEAAMSRFSGAYSAATSLALIVFVNFFLVALLRRYGFAKSLWIPPLFVIVGVAASLVFPVFPVVVATVFVRDFIVSLQLGSYRGMLIGVSDLTRNRVWSWLDGPVTATGDLIGSSFIALAAGVLMGFPVSVTVRVVGFVALVLLLVRFFLNGRLRRSFPYVLLDSLQKGDYKTRVRAMEAMAEFRFLKDRHLGAVLDVIRNEADPVTLRIQAVKTVAAINDTSSLRLLSRFFEHPDPELRKAAISAVASFHFDESTAYETGFSQHVLIGRLKDAFGRETVPETINVILKALVALHDPDIVPFLINALAAESPAVQQSCLRCLRHFHDPAIIDYARPFLKSADPGLKAQAVAATWQFSWEHGELTKQALDELVRAPFGSVEHRMGLYLIGALRLDELKGEALKALRAEEFPVRLAAAIALLKMGDRTGMPALEEALAGGSRAEAHEVERLAVHENVAEPERQRVRALSHAYHLHYPADMPVSELLRVRLHEIPRKCLEALLPFYMGEGCSSERRKIEKALLRSSHPSSKGKVALFGLEGPWDAMASVALLAHGIAVRPGSSDEPLKPNEVALGMAGDARLPEDAFVLTDKTDGLSDREIVKSHYAPSEMLHKMFPELMK